MNKDLYIVPEEDLITILDVNYAVSVYNNGKDNNHTMHISRRVYFLSHGENCKMHNIDWCEGGL